MYSIHKGFCRQKSEDINLSTIEIIWQYNHNGNKNLKNPFFLFSNSRIFSTMTLLVLSECTFSYATPISPILWHDLAKSSSNWII
mmetsp:Transcript_2592/g.9913  ORF Transcript_2592/g.9913 Transcript_2592/m.9913 type:complete len:85 (-) Transcript_2592:655-909(-)